ncbi:unnamed protein product [Cyclocybe aegerita]|uniref:Uncharacterized protein n=1 Tax=Cyclocybe aegerita TaxID=1973307 RepID=A0A8S0XZ68_CYCAE|nr:unnamed protein product [Cyclocybe aegerita]
MTRKCGGRWWRGRRRVGTAVTASWREWQVAIGHEPANLNPTNFNLFNHTNGATGTYCQLRASFLRMLEVPKQLQACKIALSVPGNITSAPAPLLCKDLSYLTVPMYHPALFDVFTACRLLVWSAYHSFFSAPVRRLRELLLGQGQYDEDELLHLIRPMQSLEVLDLKFVRCANLALQCIETESSTQSPLLPNLIELGLFLVHPMKEERSALVSVLQSRGYPGHGAKVAQLECLGLFRGESMLVDGLCNFEG